MPITEEQRQERRGFVGSSDIPALFGLCPFKKPLDIYRSKTEDEEEKKSASKSLGNHLESGIVDYTIEKLQATGLKDVRFVHGSGILAANLDAVLETHFFRKPIEEACALEVKTTGFQGEPPEAAKWGRGGSAVIPPRVYLQVQQQLACSGYNLAIVALLSGHDGKGCRHYRIPRHERTIKAIEAVSETFWRDHVLARNPPAADAVRITPRPVPVHDAPTQDDPEVSVP